VRVEVEMKDMSIEELISYRDDCRDFLETGMPDSKDGYIVAHTELLFRFSSLTAKVAELEKENKELKGNKIHFVGVETMANISSLQGQVESLKCCGNCKVYGEIECSKMIKIEETKDVEAYFVIPKIYPANSYCPQWQSDGQEGRK
jgi:hypothetical protein